MSVTAFAASNPADDVSTYSYNTGRQAYEARMAEKPAWFDNEDEATTANYSFHAGNQAAEARIEAFKAMPTGENLTDEELADQNITQSTIRLSIGTEHIDDIIADLEKGFAAI